MRRIERYETSDHIGASEHVQLERPSEPNQLIEFFVFNVDESINDVLDDEIYNNFFEQQGSKNLYDSTFGDVNWA